MYLELSRHIVLLSKGWYPRAAGGSKEQLICFLAAWSSSDPKVYSNRSLWQILVDVIRDVGKMNELCNCMRDWFSGWPGHGDKVEIEEAITTLISSLGITRKDDFDFDLGEPDPRVVEDMQKLINLEGAEAIKTLTGKG